ncbi:hypothetical protein ABZ746_15955 [Streptomyces sp. NPDC020096]
MLGLVAGAMRCRRERPSTLVGVHGAGVGADDVQAKVDSGGHTRRGEHVAIVDPTVGQLRSA